MYTHTLRPVKRHRPNHPHMESSSKQNTALRKKLRYIVAIKLLLTWKGVNYFDLMRAISLKIDGTRKIKTAVKISYFTLHDSKYLLNLTSQVTH